MLRIIPLPLQGVIRDKPVKTTISDKAAPRVRSIRSSTGEVRGDHLRPLNTPRLNGWTGSTTGGCSRPSAISHLPKPGNAITQCWTTPQWQHNLMKLASGNPGAIHDTTEICPIMVKKLQDGYIEASQENLARFLAQYGIDNFTYSPINHGIENSSFKVISGKDTYAFRVYRYKSKTESDISLEVNAQDFFRSNGIPIPIIHRAANGKTVPSSVINRRKYYAILMDFIHGTNITLQPSHGILSDLAGYHAKMHLLGSQFSNTVNGTNWEWDYIGNEIPKHFPAHPGYEEFVERAKAYTCLLPQGLPHGHNHMDLSFDGNIIIAGGTIKAIIDFGDIYYSPIAACLGYTLWHILEAAGEENMRHYLREYVKIRALSDLEYEVLPGILASRNYAVGITRLTHYANDRREGQMQNLLRLEQDIPSLRFDRRQLY